MKRILSLGITNPLLRVVVWLVGCASCTLAGALLGPLGLGAVLAVLSSAILGRLAA